MSAWALPPNRHPLWRVLGLGLVGATLGLSTLFLIRGARPLQPRPTTELFTGPKGSLGTLTEQLGNGRFVLSYEAIHGAEEDLYLSGVEGSLDEPDAHWRMGSPAAHRRQGYWTLEGPLDLSSGPRAGAPITGKGRVEKDGPALKWDKGAWEGLAPLEWEELGGSAKGLWRLPAGWRRDLAGRLTVPSGPVRWEARGPGTLHDLEAASLWAEKGFAKAHLARVKARVEGGSVEAEAADLFPTEIRWSGPVTFVRDDGWRGGAEGGIAPRPEPGQSLQQLEFHHFGAQRHTEAGPERVAASGARWTGAGLRLEGDVRWEQPMDGQALWLRAPRVLIREAAGPDLPQDLPIGEARAEGQALLTWGPRSLASPRIEARRLERTWRLEAPVQGRAEDGTFSAGEGQGSPRKWRFEGPVLAQLFDGSSLRGAQLTWEAETWTLTGSPVTWTRLRERLSGPRLVRIGDRIQFPAGLSGSVAAPEGDLTLRADRAEGEPARFLLEGRVVCAGQGWRLEAERVTLQLGPGRVVRRVLASGALKLRSKDGEGRGEALELDPKGGKATWQGRVRGSGEVGW